MSATNVGRAGKRGNICVGNNVSATMCPRLPVPLDKLLFDRFALTLLVALLKRQTKITAKYILTLNSYNRSTRVSQLEHQQISGVSGLCFVYQMWLHVF